MDPSKDSEEIKQNAKNVFLANNSKLDAILGKKDKKSLKSNETSKHDLKESDSS